MEKETTIFGIRAVIEAVKSGESIDKVFLQKGLRGELYHELEQLLRKEGINCSYVPIEKLNRLTKMNHQGAVAQIAPIDFYDLEGLVMNVLESGKTAMFLLLDQLSDVRNFGAIVRTAECTGVSGIIVQKKGGAPVNGDAIKTSAGALFKVPICKVDHIKDAVFYLQASGINVIAATEKTNDTIYDVSFKEPCAIIMGSEGKGINPSVLKVVNAKAKLPLLGEIESLNVSVACGAFLYEAVRQRR
ncbi:23S rRNA (guanosine(2251)-2'-O)-methyltransferase RlmB [Psychroserpens sp.]|uniref:23S rRNA (guanosine(2251)-2'-O)-methyltransferase RlmB n=1 Tax=Psychroserpens sp. TaxID=2020870 RepID=UPI001B2B11E2|nr:23S rRNA (guanosine(2251)-2'-O)-methyltransferase RlmB [Psychroserpens sp.]MBO6606207.1 23S rRNA (guanosine(2251)-2'-O)-methyltransferase RlmB [Psychroserpens sp.]MBO6630503.1 23S rRNA (guanosine(2251)-2'-O)-methyltransferase RlmB [Psychroserpens sp.]MBO6652421.1 23S rRNA (guanosine(2251)-2'-O)-methyltransferase RlmB [Psychroserpens sp.]MBO6681807.1 23S rRNA (guanosine(2251)-2'-O)-methyltransferase RlmB [Psychroserpens sp.]MBO6749582.1 23S rRNA (guanosine(2251)-2'-O)-methyltransferase RlmB 